MDFITSESVAQLTARYRARIADAEATKATAPLADVFKVALGELEAANVAEGVAAGPPPPDRLLDAAEVAARLGMKRKHVYNRAAAWPFTRRLGQRTLRFSERGLEQWIAKRGAR